MRESETKTDAKMHKHKELTNEQREKRREYMREYMRHRRVNMTPEQREAAKEYRCKWVREHPEQVKAAQARYWLRKLGEGVPE